MEYIQLKFKTIFETHTMESNMMPIEYDNKKYYWKDNDNKPWCEGDRLCDEMSVSLKPNISPNEFSAGHVWTTEFRNITYIVDIEYNGSSTTTSRFWNYILTCPPCLDAKNYNYMHVVGGYYVEHDEQGNKFWCEKYGNDEHSPIQMACKYPKGHKYTTSSGRVCISCRLSDGSAIWNWM